MNLSKRKYNFLVFLSFMVVFSLALPSKFNVGSIYIFSLFSIFIIVKQRVFSIKNEFIILGISYFLIHGIHYFIDNNTSTIVFEIEKKLSFLFLPLLIINLPIKNKKDFIRKVLTIFIYGMSILGIAILSIATYKFINTNNINVYYYHNLVYVFNGNAIYYSLLFMFSFVLLLEEYKATNSKFNAILIGFNAIIIILLASKIFVALLFLIFIIYIIKSNKNRVSFGVIFAIICTFPFIINGDSITRRFKNIDISNLLETKNDITESTTFDGFELRKELWKIGYEIGVKNTKTILIGIGPGDSQDELNKVLHKKGFYSGIKGTKDIGYLQYNFHNQYIQTFVETGLLGLFFLILIFLYLFHLGIKMKNKKIILFNLVFVISFMTESILSRQIGIISFVGFNSFLILSANKNTFNLNIKRVFDIIFSLLVILFLLSWLLPILYIISTFDTKSFPVFTQKRAGKNGITFNCFKLRTMVVNRKSNHLAAQINDNRISKTGAILRKYALDELPQFFNVLFGNMSVVGPRPLMIYEEKKNSKIIPLFSSRLEMKPGITGLAQSHGYKGYMDDNPDLRIRYRLDKKYVKKQTLTLDIWIIIKTIIYIIKQKK